MSKESLQEKVVKVEEHLKSLEAENAKLAEEIKRINQRRQQIRDNHIANSGSLATYRSLLEEEQEAKKPAEGGKKEKSK